MGLTRRACDPVDRTGAKTWKSWSTFPDERTLLRVSGKADIIIYTRVGILNGTLRSEGSIKKQIYSGEARIQDEIEYKIETQ